MQFRPSRRAALARLAAPAVVAACGRGAVADEPAARGFDRVGLILYPWEIEARPDWPDRAAAAGFTTVGLHAARRLDVLTRFVDAPAGRAFLRRCGELGLAVEYELHAAGDLLSRELFYQDETLFRQDERGRRTPDVNLCPSNPRALEIVAAGAVRVARTLRPTSGRYFYWTDDAGETCRCDRCTDLSAADQAVLTENAIVAALRAEVDPRATLAHLAYQDTWRPPTVVKPHPGLFLEFAFIRRDHEAPLDLTAAVPESVREGVAVRPKTNAAFLDLLDRNLAVFPAATAQALEYHLDASYFARWRRPAPRLPFREEIVQRDAALLADRGLKSVTTFALWLDEDYERRFGPPPLAEWAAAFKNPA